MYDYITCKMPLPEWPEGKRVPMFQTKSFYNPCLSNYIINEDGSLIIKSYLCNHQKDDSVTGVNYQEPPAKDVPIDFSGMLEFYDYYHHADYTVQDAYAFEIGHITYNAAVNNGKVTKIKCVSNVAPRELSDEEIEEKAAKYEAAVAENRKKMIQYRKENPSPTQKFVDDISELINNKSAIADQSDYIRVINRIEELVKDWREQNDPWFYHE